jgi:hypothetical protein
MAGSPPHARENNPVRLAQAIRELFAGRSNAVGEVTLTESDTTTTVAAVNCGLDSKIFLFPTTADAATEWAAGSLYISAVARGEFTITHANDASTTRTFFWLAIG